MEAQAAPAKWLWDKAEQVKERSNKGKLEVQHRVARS